MQLSGSALLLLAFLPAAASLQARQPVYAKHGMVVAEEPLAADIGRAVLQSGGNAIDAAVATGFALAVTHPVAGNLGGGGFLLARFADGRTVFLDFRERAPGSATRDMYLGPDGSATRDSIVGWRAAGVPGTVRGLEAAHQRFGSRRWAELIKPASRLAAAGFPVSHTLAASLTASSSLSQFPESNRIFLNNGKPFTPGDRLLQPDLSATLNRIARHGAKDFYEGETARRLAAAMSANGGLITLDDLRSYAIVERTPLEGSYRGYQLITAPPPSSGGIGLLQMLGVLQDSGYQQAGPGAARTIHFVAEAMRRFFADRSEHLGDPDFVKVPERALLDPRYIASLRASINPDRATPSSQVRPGSLTPYESDETTHYSVVDSAGNAVSVTYTLNGNYGSGVTVPGLGFLLNNEMDDFAARPGTPNMFGLVQGESNAIAPRKRPLSSMTPTIVLRDGKLFLVYGGPGGGRIITSVLQVFLNIVDFGMNVQDAIDAPRFHHQWQPDTLSVEQSISPDSVHLLESMGHRVERSRSIARIEAILIDKGWRQGGADGRVSAKAAGY